MSTTATTRRFSNGEEVRRYLRDKCGVQENIELGNSMTSCCLQRAILTGKVKIPDKIWDSGGDDQSDFLDCVVFEGECPECKKPNSVTCTVEDMIWQNDMPSDCDIGPMVCSSCECSWFLTKLCDGTPELVDYTSHKHSPEGGPDCGECLGSYDYCHCPQCGDVFDRGISYSSRGNSCPSCGWPDILRDDDE